MRNILLSAFSIPILRAVCCNLNLNFIFYYGSYYLLLPICSVQNRDMEWILIFGFFLFSFFIFGYNIIFDFCFFFCNGDRWSLDKPSSLISVVLVWGLCSVVLGKPLSVFSGRCLHNPVHTPILSLYRKTINKKNESIMALVAYLHSVCVKLTQVCVCTWMCMCVDNFHPGAHWYLLPAQLSTSPFIIIITSSFFYLNILFMKICISLINHFKWKSSHKSACASR